jgi:hypothetical protein
MPMITVGGTTQRLGAALRDRGHLPGDDGLGWLPGSIEETLLCRRSVREFSADPLPVSRVHAAMAAARDAEAAAWPPRLHGAPTFEVLIAAFRVDGLPRGLFAIRDSCPVELAGPGSTWLDSLRGQYADAPALLLI